MLHPKKQTTVREKTLMFLSFTLSVFILLYKRPDAFYSSQFWAEEGVVFFAEAYHTGFNSLFNTCAGYYHLFPRLVACISTGLNLPLHIIPFVFCYSWLLIFFVLLLYVWKRLPYTALQRFFISITLVLIPTQSEIIMNLTNLQWIMVFFPILIFSSSDPEKNKKWFYADFLMLILAGLTGPNYTVLLPLFVLALVLQRKLLKQNKYTLILYLTAVSCALISIFSLLHHGNISRTEGGFTLLNEGFIHYLFVQYYFLFFGKFALTVPLVIMCLGLVLIAVLFIKMSTHFLRGQPHYFPVISLFTGLLFLATTLIAYRNAPSLLDPYYRGVRNFYIPAVTFIWTLIVFLSSKKRGTAIISVIMIWFSIQTFLFVKPFQFDDFNIKHYSEKIKTVDTLSIPINPAGWYITIDNKKLNRSK